ncbi:MAG: 6-phosphofructokinase [Anaerolineaceae bacterium]|nr:6-phosphofructokinase [Anaerolineaceae bacterium]
MAKTIGILTGGGDVPGLNPAMKTVVLNALDDGYRVLGIRRGWGGLLNYNLDDPATHDYYIRELSRWDVRTIDRTGGTFLHTSRTNPQNVKPETVPDFLKNSGLGKQVKDDGTMDYTDHILKVLEHLGIDALIPIGGDDTLSFAARIHNEGFPCVCIPKTMDNDVFGTDYCIGFSTAITRSIEFLTNMRTSVGSHERIGIVELFGRNSGETSLFAGLLACVDRVVIPEVECNIAELAELLLEDKRNCPSNYALMTISEGSIIKGSKIIETGEEDDYGHKKLGGVGQLVAEEIKRRTGQHVMFQQPAYLMRSGAPDSLDRMVAMCYGNLATQLLKSGDTGTMVGLQNGCYTAVPIDYIMSGKKIVEVEKYYDSKQYRPAVNDILGIPMFLQ